MSGDSLLTLAKLEENTVLTPLIEQLIQLGFKKSSTVLSGYSSPYIAEMIVPQTCKEDLSDYYAIPYDEKIFNDLLLKNKKPEIYISEGSLNTSNKNYDSLIANLHEFSFDTWHQDNYINYRNSFSFSIADTELGGKILVFSINERVDRESIDCLLKDTRYLDSYNFIPLLILEHLNPISIITVNYEDLTSSYLTLIKTN